MYLRILRRMRDKVRRRQYVVTFHAWKEMGEDEFTVYDVECGLLAGEILERQRDRVTGEAKYRVRGKALDGAPIEILVKIGPTGKLVIITVYGP